MVVVAFLSGRGDVGGIIVGGVAVGGVMIGGAGIAAIEDWVGVADTASARGATGSGMVGEAASLGPAKRVPVKAELGIVVILFATFSTEHRMYLVEMVLRN